MKLKSYYTTLLTTTFSGNNETIKSAENELCFQFKNELFLETMYEILIETPLQNLKLSTTNLLKQYSRYLMNNSYQAPLAKFVDTIISLLKSNPFKPPISLPMKIVLMLCDNLKFIFTKDYVHSNRIAAIKNVSAQLESVRKNSYNCSPDQCIYLVLLTRSLISSPMFDTLNNGLFEVSFDVLVQLSTQIYTMSIEKGETLGEEPIAISLLISDMLFFYLRRSDVRTNPVIQNIIWSPKLENLLVISLKSTFGHLKGIYSEEQKQNTLQLMKIQANTFELTQIIARYRLSQFYKDKFHHDLLKLNPDIIQALKMALSVGTPKLSSNPSVLTTITNIIRMFQTLIRYQPHSQYFSQNKQDIYKGAILPLLQIPGELKQSFLDKPDAFINFFNYVFDSSMIDDDKITDELLSLKTSVSQFLVMSCEFVGVLETLLTFSLQILQTSSNFNERSICMTIIGILSYNVRSKSDILKSIKLFLESQIHESPQLPSDVDYQILQILSMMLVSKFLVPISNQQFSDRTFQYIMKVLESFSSEPHRVLALEILTQLIKLEGNFKESSERLIEYLIAMSNNPHEDVKVFDILLELYSHDSTLKYNFPLNMKICVYFVNKLKSIKGGQPISHILQSKCWNMINMIVEIDFSQSQETLMFVRAIEKQVSALYQFLQLEDLNDFKQQIFKFNLFLLIRTKEISLYQQLIVMWLPIIIENSSTGIDLVYEFLLLFNRYGYTYVESSPEVQDILFVECAKASYALYQGQSEKESQAIKGIILLEILLLYSSRMNPPSLNEIIQKLINLIQNCHIYYTFTKANLVSFLAFCLVNISTFTNKQLITKILKIVFDECDCVNVDFSSKIYVLALSTLFRDQSLSSAVRCDQKQLIVSCITQVLTFSLQNSNPDYDDEEKEYFENVKLIFSNIPDIDEVQYFKTILLEFKEKDPSKFKQIVQELNDSTKNNLSALLRTQFVHSEARQILKVDRTRIN